MMQNLDGKSMFPKYESYMTLFDVLTKHVKEYEYKLWSESEVNVEITNTFNSHPRKWIFRPYELHNNILKGDIVPYVDRNDIFVEGFNVTITDSDYIKIISKIIGNDEINAHSFELIPENLICIEHAQMFYIKFPAPLYNKNKPRCWDNKMPRLIYGINVLGIGKDIKDSAMTSFYAGWNPYERGLKIQKKIFKQH